MQYKMPYYNELGGIGAPMNPLFVSEAVALGPTRVMDVPYAGYASMPSYGLDGWREAMDVFSAAAFLFPA